MRLLGIFLLSSAATFAQTATFPSAVATDNQLRVAVNNVGSTITQNIGASDTTVQILNGTGFAANTVGTIDNEEVAICAVSGTTLTIGKSACPSTDGRGFDGTAAATHAAGAAIDINTDAWHHNSLKAEVQAIETALGPGLSNISLNLPAGQPNRYMRIKPNTGNSTTYEFAALPDFQAADYAWTAQTPNDTWSAASSNVIHYAPCPAGFAVAASGGMVATPALISGGGSTEAVLATGGTCMPGAASGTVIFSSTNVTGAPVAAHSAGYTVSPASFGVQEAVNAACSAGGGQVHVAAGSFTLSARIWVSCSNLWLEGSGASGGAGGGTGGTNVTRSTDFGDSIYAGSADTSELINIRIEGLSITHQLNYAAGPPPTISNKPTSGANVHLLNCWECAVRNNRLQNLPYGIDADTVGRTFIQYNATTGLWDNFNSNAQVSIAGIFLHHSQAGAGLPTYTYVDHNEVNGAASAARTITVNGNNIAGHIDPVGPQFGIWVASCEVCEITKNSVEWENYSGIHVAAVASHAVADALLDTLISENYVDYNRMYGVDFDMSANPGGMFALNFRMIANRIWGSGASINGIFFAPPATPWTFVRTAAQTIISGNTIGLTLGSGVAMWSGGLTKFSGNTVTGYNQLNSFPTNSLTCNASGCAGDRIGNSAVWISGAAASCNVTNNILGGIYSGGGYDGASVFTVNGVGIGYYSGYGPPNCVTAPNQDGGVQAVTARSPAVHYDPGFLEFPGTVTNGNISTMAISTCGTLGATSTPLAGMVTSGTTGTCAVGLGFDTALAKTGWACNMQNITHPGTGNMIFQTAVGLSGANFSGTTVSGDQLVYACKAY